MAEHLLRCRCLVVAVLRVEHLVRAMTRLAARSPRWARFLDRRVRFRNIEPLALEPLNVVESNEWLATVGAEPQRIEFLTRLLRTRRSARRRDQTSELNVPAVLAGAELTVGAAATDEVATGRLLSAVCSHVPKLRLRLQSRQRPSLTALRPVAVCRNQSTSAIVLTTVEAQLRGA